MRLQREKDIHTHEVLPTWVQGPKHWGHPPGNINRELDPKWSARTQFFIHMGCQCHRQGLAHDPTVPAPNLESTRLLGSRV